MTNRISKRAAGLLLGSVAAISLVLTGCSSNAGSQQDDGASEDNPSIAFLLPDTVTARWEGQDAPVFKSQVKKTCPECQIKLYNAKGSPETQLSQATAAVTNGADVLAVIAVDTSSAASLVSRVKQTPDVSVISYARVIPSEKVDYAVTTDTYTIGAQQAQGLVDNLHERGITEGDLIVLNGSPTDSFAPIYKAGAHSVLDESGFTVAAEYMTKDWSTDVARDQAEQAITKLGKDGFVGIYAANDGLAAGAISAMKAAGIDPSTRPVTGQDATLAGLQRIVAGEQANTIYQPIKEFGATAADLAVAIAKGQKDAVDEIVNGEAEWDGGTTPAHLYKTKLITVDNIEETIVPKGFWELDEICTSDYAAACKEAGLQ